MKQFILAWSGLIFSINVTAQSSLNQGPAITNSPTSFTAGYDVVNRTIEIVPENGKSVIRFSEAPQEGLAWVKGVEFSDGVIEFDAKGRDVLQKSFIGVAFHGIDNQTYECVYFRPFNFQATDPVRKVHAVQYMSVPQFDFQTLRNTRKDEFESAILLSTIQATEWFHVKIEVREGRIKVFANNSPQPCLDVSSLNLKIKTGKVGFWVGNNSNGDFTNLTIGK